MVHRNDSHIISTLKTEVKHRAIALQELLLIRDRALFDSLSNSEKTSQGGVLLQSVIRARENWVKAALSNKTAFQGQLEQ